MSNNNKRAVHIATITRVHNGKTYVTHLLRHTYRENGKVKQLTLGNLSDLPDDLIALMKKRLAGEPLPAENDDFEIVRSLPHGHIVAVLGVLRKIGLDQIITLKLSRESQLAIAMIVLRIIAPGSKLANLTGLQSETAEHSLASELGLDTIETPEIYHAMDWLFQRQTRIENKLAKKHLSEGTLVLYDVSSSYCTGRQSELVKMGYNRDGKPGEAQIVYGLRCTPDGCPISIEVFPGNTADPTTFTAQVTKIRKRFGLKRVVMVGDRGMITSKRIDEDLRDIEGVEWITALRNESIKKLVEQKAIQLSLFDSPRKPRILLELSSFLTQIGKKVGVKKSDWLSHFRELNCNSIRLVKIATWTGQGEISDFRLPTQTTRHNVCKMEGRSLQGLVHTTILSTTDSP